jgi:hypothetical protein
MLRIKADVQGENNIRRLGNSMQGLQGQAKNAAAGVQQLEGCCCRLWCSDRWQRDRGWRSLLL